MFAMHSEGPSAQAPPERKQRPTTAAQVILAVRTKGPLERAFGLVVFEMAGAGLAREFMQSDPAIMAGAMSATLHRHSVAQQRK
jgi:hypothetical protein